MTLTIIRDVYVCTCAWNSWQMSIFNSVCAKIIISCSVAQRYHGVFLIFEFDRFFSEPTIRFFSGPRGQFFSEPTPVSTYLVTRRLGTSSNSFNHLAVSFATCPSIRGWAPSTPLSLGITGTQAATHSGSWGFVGSFTSFSLELHWEWKLTSRSMLLVLAWNGQPAGWWVCPGDMQMD